MKKKLFSVLLALMLALSLCLVTAVPVAAQGPSTFTVTDGSYTTEMVDEENGNISATLTGTWDTDVIGDFTATGTGGLYVVGETWGTTATIAVSGTLSELKITFSGTAEWISGDPITDDEVYDISGLITINPDGSYDADLTGTVAGPVSVDLDMAGPAGSISISMVTEPSLTKANILKDSGVPGKGLENAPGQQKPFNPNSKAGEHAGKKK